MKVISPNGIEYVFTETKFAVINTQCTDLYADQNKMKWIAQVPNSWLLINGDFNQITDHNITPEKADKSMTERYQAGCFNGKFTGFIPCSDHAKKILKGEITPFDLIKNRSNKVEPFPFEGYNEFE